VDAGAGVALLFGIIGVLVYAAIAAMTGGRDDDVGTGSLSPHDHTALSWRDRLDELPSGDDARHAVPCAFAMLLFSFSCHAMIPGFEQGMRPSQRRLFPAVVVTTFGGCAALKAVFMSATWLAFGAKTPQVATTSLEPFALNAAATIAVAVNTVLTIPTFLFIIQQILSGVWPLPAEDGRAGGGRWSRRALHVQGRRVCLLVVILVPAVAVPELPSLMVWVGSLASPLIIFVLPLSFHLKLRWRELRQGLYSRAVFGLLCVGHAVVLTIGISGAVLGIWVSVHPGVCVPDDVF
jgi:amino acid permease